MDSDLRLSGQLRLYRRSPYAHHARRRHRRRLPHPSLLRRIHGARRGLLALLCLPQPLHVLHVDPGAGQQLPSALRRLGGRGPRLVPADRLLLQERLRLRRREKSLHRQPHRRLRLPAGDVPSRRPLRQSQLHRHLRHHHAAPRVAGRHPDRHRASAGPRSHRQVRADSALHLAARRHGRPHAGLRPHSRCNDGHGGHLHGRPLPHAV